MLLHLKISKEKTTQQKILKFKSSLKAEENFNDAVIVSPIDEQ